MSTMVAADAQIKIFGQIEIDQSRTMSFQRIKWLFLMDGFNELADLRIIVFDDLPIIHHFAQTDDILFCFELHHIFTSDRAAAGLILLAQDRHVGRNGVVTIIRTFFAILDHRQYSIQPADIGDLMRLRNDGRQTISCCVVTKGGWRHHRRFDMHVDIDEARDHVTAFAIDRLLSIHFIRKRLINI